MNDIDDGDLDIWLMHGKAVVVYLSIIVACIGIHWNDAADVVSIVPVPSGDARDFHIVQVVTLDPDCFEAVLG